MKFLHYVRIFLAPILQVKWYTCTLAIEAFLWALLPMVSMFFVSDMMRVLQAGNLSMIYDTIKWYATFFFGIICLTILMYRSWWVRYLESIQSILYRQYIHEFVQLDPQSIETIGTGKLLHMIQNGVKIHGAALTDIVLYSIRFALALIITFWFILPLGWIYVILSVILFILLGVYMYLIDQKQIIIRKNKYEQKKNVSSIVTRVIMSKNDMLSDSLREKQIAHIDYACRQMIQNNIRQNVWMTLLFRGTEWAIFLLHLALIAIAAKSYFSGQLSLSAIVSISVAFGYFEKVIIDCVTFYKNFTKDISEVTGLWDFFRSTPRMTHLIEWEIFEPKWWLIRFRNVDFCYHEWKIILHNLSIDFQPKKITALVGPSGWGKSTITKLILGYLHPWAGSLSIDGQDISKLSLQSLYKHVGYLPQEPNVFDGTIRDNLLGTAPEASDEELERALHLAGCDFIADLPHGIDTEIGERWIRLSGGQKQRLAIAKIFLKNPEIIILDEPTSALDSFSEEKISHALRTLFHDKTVIIIAHRLQTVKHADEIIVIESGRVVESGNHTKLVSQNGYYAKMLELQSGF